MLQPVDGHCTNVRLFVFYFIICSGRDLFGQNWILPQLIPKKKNCCVFSPSDSGWARLAAYTDPTSSTKPLNVAGWTAERGSSPWETSSWSGVNPGTPCASPSCSCCGKRGPAGNFYPALNFISYPRILPRDAPSATER